MTELETQLLRIIEEQQQQLLQQQAQLQKQQQALDTCKRPDSKAQRLCIQINKNAGEWQNGYMIPMGY